MKKLRLIIVSMVGVLFLAMSVTAQTSATAKIALIDTASFYEKDGINHIADGFKRLGVEMKPMVDKYNAKVVEYNNLKKSYTTLVENAQKNIPVKKEDLQVKEEQIVNLETELKRMQEDLKTQQEKREGEIMQPITQKIGTSIQAFAKQKGYTLVLDIGRLASAQMVLYIDETTNITDEFIKFYNGPGGTATK